MLAESSTTASEARSSRPRNCTMDWHERKGPTMKLFLLIPMYPLSLPEAIEVFIAIVSALMLSWSLSLAVLQKKLRRALMGARELPPLHSLHRCPEDGEGSGVNVWW